MPPGPPEAASLVTISVGGALGASACSALLKCNPWAQFQKLCPAALTLFQLLDCAGAWGNVRHSSGSSAPSQFWYRQRVRQVQESDKTRVVRCCGRCTLQGRTPIDRGSLYRCVFLSGQKRKKELQCPRCRLHDSLLMTAGDSSYPQECHFLGINVRTRPLCPGYQGLLDTRILYDPGVVGMPMVSAERQRTLLFWSFEVRGHWQSGLCS